MQKYQLNSPNWNAYKCIVSLLIRLIFVNWYVYILTTLSFSLEMVKMGAGWAGGCQEGTPFVQIT